MGVGAAVVASVALWTVALVAVQPRPSPPPERIQHLQSWLTAVQRHQPGESDEWVSAVASWNLATLWRVWIDVGTIVSLIRDPGLGLFFTPNEPEPFSTALRRRPNAKPRGVLLYDRTELALLREIADEIAEGEGEDALLKRAAVYHIDLAMLASSGPSGSASSRRPSSSRVIVYMSDGQQTGLDVAHVHWEMGRRLLDKVRDPRSPAGKPDPGADQTVRLWYLAVGAYMQSVEQLDPWQFERSVQLFPNDPDILFVAACAHEMFSSPQIQSVLEALPNRQAILPDVGGQAGELRSAERLFRQVLDRDPNRIEPRIRLGRVLGRRGQHEEAIGELRRAMAATDNPLLLFYANLFLGGEESALGRIDQARQAYRRASDLYPRAQSPRLALSALAARDGDTTEALAAAKPILDRDEDAALQDDPWWSYHTVQSRALDGLLTELRRSIAPVEK